MFQCIRNARHSTKHIVAALAFWLASPANGDFVDKLPPAPTAIPVQPAGGKNKKSKDTKKQTAKDKNAKSGKSAPAVSNEPSAQSGGGLMTSNDVFEHDTAAPLTYRAEDGGGSRKDGVLELSKNVVIVQNELTLNANKAELYTVAGSSTPNKVVAKGDVKLEKKGLTPETTINAVAEEIEYFATTRKAVLRGKPKIWKGKEMLRGEVIELDMNTEAIRVKNPSGVVDPKSAKGEGESSAK